MIVVVDASAAVRAVMGPGSRLTGIFEEPNWIIAPDLIVAEVCSAFRKYVRSRIMTIRQAESFATRAIGLIDEIQPMRVLASDVMRLAGQTDSSIYDLFYLALAQRANAAVLTADMAFQKTVLKIGVALAGTNEPSDRT